MARATMFPVGGHTLFEALVNAGFEMPKECVSAGIKMEVDSILQITFVCNIVPEDLPKIAKAFEAMAKEKN